MQRGVEDEGRGYREIAEAIRRDIGSGRIELGSLLPTERELYASFNVSRTTIRRALQTLVRSGWAVTEPNRGHIASKPTSTSESRLVGYIDHGNSIHQSLFFTLSRSLAQRGFLLTHIDSEEIGTEAALQLAAAQGLFGAIVWSKTSVPNVDLIQKLPHTLHWVTVMHQIPGLPADHVQPNLYEIARTAVHHLHRNGARRIAVTGIMDGFHAHHEAFSGYLAGCLDLKLPVSPADFLFVRTSTSTAVETRPILGRFLDSDRPDGLLMLQDMWVAEIADALQQAGRKVPEDVLVCGMGNDFPFSFGNSGLTTFAYDWNTAADLVAEMLLRPTTDSTARNRARTFQGELVVRGSCAEPEDGWSDFPYTPNRAIPLHSVPFDRAGQLQFRSVPSPTQR